MIKDSIVDEIHVIREQLAAKYNYDVMALGNSYLERQQSERRSVVSRRPKPVILQNYTQPRKSVDDQPTEKAA